MLDDIKLSAFFTPEKISKVRWVPEHLREADNFLTGSWEMDTNYVRLYRIQNSPFCFGGFYPECFDKVAFDGDITGIEPVRDKIFAVSSSDGRVTLLKTVLNSECGSLQTLGTSPLLHKFATINRAAPCTALSVYGKDIATVGEDGYLNIIDAANLGSIHRSFEADSCALTAVLYVNPKEVITANRMGVVRIFDIRTDGVAAKFVMASCQDEKHSNYVSCLTSHPTQPYIVLAGTEEGSINTWDLRNIDYPASYLSGHKRAITEMAFHKVDPSKLFTASECGEMWMWSEHEEVSTGFEVLKTEHQNVWLTGDRIKQKVDIRSLISDLKKPLNSFDAHGSRVIGGADTEAVYIFDYTW